MKKQISFPAIILLLTGCMLVFITCQKEYSYEGGLQPATAVYSLNAAGGVCSNAVVPGNYFAGIALNDSNTVQVQVNVTVTGAYAINSNSADGFKFSASGSFTQTGVQTVLLKTSGKPLSDGNFDFTFSGGSSCSLTIIVKKIIVEKVVFKLSGAPDSCTAAVVTNNYIMDTTLKSSNTVTLNVTVIAVGPFTLNTDTINGMSFSASGIFTSTGENKVVLKGAGIPAQFGSFTFTPIIDSSACTFAVFVKPLPADYVLESFTANAVTTCNHYEEGTCIAGQALADSNIIFIRAYCVTPGCYTISTNTINGMTFSGTGILYTAGSHDVPLTGTGTPSVSGDFSLLPKIVGPAPFGGASCGVIVTVN